MVVHMARSITRPSVEELSEPVTTLSVTLYVEICLSPLKGRICFLACGKPQTRERVSAHSINL